MNEEKMKKAFTDEIFVKSLLQLESVAEVQEFLKEKGVELSEEEIIYIGKALKINDSDELSDDELEAVAGGIGAVTTEAMAIRLIDTTISICGIGANEYDIRW